MLILIDSSTGMSWEEYKISGQDKLFSVWTIYDDINNLYIFHATIFLCSETTNTIIVYGLAYDILRSYFIIISKAVFINLLIFIYFN